MCESERERDSIEKFEERFERVFTGLKRCVFV